MLLLLYFEERCDIGLQQKGDTVVKIFSAIISSMRDFRLKLLVSGYRVYFHALALLSDERAANAALDRFSRPKSRKRRSLQLPIFKDAEWAHLQTPTGKLAHYHWAGSGHMTVLFAHGWESDAGTFGPMVEHMLSKGYSVRALDAPAHGMSEGKKLNLLEYARAIHLLVRESGDVSLCVGHSFGGMATALASSFDKEAFPPSALVASAVELRRSMETYFKMLQFSEKMQNAISEAIERKHRKPISWFSLPRMIEEAKHPFLLIHDIDDKVCPLDDLQGLMDASPAHARFRITRGHGHRRILREKSIWEEILQFAEDSRESLP